MNLRWNSGEGKIRGDGWKEIWCFRCSECIDPYRLRSSTSSRDCHSDPMPDSLLDLIFQTMPRESIMVRSAREGLLTSRIRFALIIHFLSPDRTLLSLSIIINRPRIYIYERISCNPENNLWNLNEWESQFNNELTRRAGEIGHLRRGTPRKARRFTETGTVYRRNALRNVVHSIWQR